MAWIELHDTLPDNPKVIEVATALKMDKDAVVGKLVRLWTWALQNREDGHFTSKDIETIAEVMRYRGNAQRFVDVLVHARLLDRDEDNLYIHDWDEHVCMLLEKREVTRAKTRARVQKHRMKRSCNALHVTQETDESNASNAATVPYRTKDDDEEEEEELTRIRAREGDEYADYLKTAVEASEAIHAQYDGLMREVWTKSFNKPPTGEQLDFVVDLAARNRDSDPVGFLAAEAIRNAALVGANSPTAYIKTLLQDWHSNGVKTIEDLADLIFRRDHGLEAARG